MERAKTPNWIARVFHPTLFFLAAAGIYVAAITIAGMLPRLRQADLVAIGIACDLVLVVPAMYYVLLVRGRGWRAIGLVPVSLLGLVAASWIVPAKHQQLLSALEWTVVPLELVVLGLIARRAAVSLRRVRSRTHHGGTDMFDAIRRAAGEAVGSARIGDVVAQEIATLWYALGSWRTPLPPEDEGFTSYRENGYGLVVAAIGIVLVVETVAVHLAVHLLWSASAAFVLTALGAYGLLWMIGDFQALRLRRTTVTSRRIDLRIGTRWEVTIPRDAVLEVARATTSPRQVEDPREKPLNLVLIGSPDVDLRLSRPVTARGMFGRRRATKRIRLQIDDAQRFLEQVRPVQSV